MTPQRAAELHGVVDAAQRAAGVLGARARGDREDAAALIASFGDAEELAGGTLLVAELLLGLYSKETGRSADACIRELTLQMEVALGR